MSGQNQTINNAQVAHSGTYTIVVTDGNGCQSTANTVVTVNALPPVSIIGLSSAYKSTEMNISLQGNHSPEGTFTGEGVINSLSKFYPIIVTTLGTNFPITYSYTDANNCTNAVSQNVMVLKTSAVFENLNSTYCYTDAANNFYVTSPDITGTGTYKHTKKHGLQDLANNHAILTPSLMGSGYDTITFTFNTAAGEDKISKVVFY